MMDCGERQRLQKEWVAEHDRLCLTLDDYERKLATLQGFDQQKLASTTRMACDRAREVLEQHAREHGCLHGSLVDDEAGWDQWKANRVDHGGCAEAPEVGD
jgi:hypothetical protein